MDIQLNGSVPCGLTTHAADGSNVDADALPTITVYKNGVAVPALTAQEMTKLATGLYNYSFAASTGAGFALGNLIKVVATSVIGGITSSIDLKELVIVSWDQAADAVWAKTMSDLTAMPGVNATALAALNALFMEMRNGMRQTSADHKRYKDDEVTVAWTRDVEVTGAALTVSKAE